MSVQYNDRTNTDSKELTCTERTHTERQALIPSLCVCLASPPVPRLLIPEALCISYSLLTRIHTRQKVLLATHTHTPAHHTRQVRRDEEGSSHTHTHTHKHTHIPPSLSLTTQSADVVDPCPEVLSTTSMRALNHTHTHTHTQRERERDGEQVCVSCVGGCAMHTMLVQCSAV